MTDEEFLDQLTRHEGFVPNAYQDSLGYWTIGIGRLIDKRKGGGISKLEAQYLLRNDVDKAAKQLDDRLPWWRTLTPNRQAVLLNMTFNLGIGGLLGFKNTLEMVRTGNYEGAAKGMLASKWAKQVKGRATELAEQMRKG